MRKILALPASLLLLVSVAGCYQGPNAATTTQLETGNGIKIQAGELQIEATKVIAGNAGTDKATVAATIVNPLGPTDRLTKVTVNGIEATLTPEEIEIKPESSVPLNGRSETRADLAGLEAQPGEYVDIVFTFATNGVHEAEVLLVPPTGYYLPFAPAGTTPEPTPTFDLPGVEEEGE